MTAVEQTPESTVRAFFASWGEDLDSLTAAMSHHLADDVVWEQTGLPTAHSLQEALALMDNARRSGVAAMSVEIRALAADGNQVLTERIDRLIKADGSVAAVIPVMGVLELDDTLKVHRWREYFDISILAATRPS
jgi:limonene-1,2-epoxide hydrolase